ncbi:PREDICTED: microtubule-associated protein 9-like [Calidris pugnax]|uniref:microtubule-associated protein 9-like n=1 Tax=Calidris pugnax TaxID=198806 RepID=UPI00071DFDB9|nr:PREDICTED: microtubule-associated protein 9-like [Calidris pugnax]
MVHVQLLRQLQCGDTSTFTQPPAPPGEIRRLFAAHWGKGLCKVVKIPSTDGQEEEKEFEDELQEASSASAAREEAAEYSDDFESDEDGMLNGVGEELNGSNSGAESTKKSVAVESPLSDDDDASQKAADLENEAADDLTLSFHEKKLQQVMLLESGNIQDDRKDEECLKSQNEGNDRENNEERSAAEEDNSESDRCSDLPICELQKKRNKEESTPIPRPRVHKARNASVSGEKKAFELFVKHLLIVC